MEQNIIQRNICDEYVNDATNYAQYVNRKRAIPDVRDGLKPVQRRIVWAAYNDIRCVDLSHKVKSQKLTGAVIGEYHPHGDSAVYDAMKPLTNWFEINMPLFNGEGGWGDFQGHKQSAARYTETFLSPFCIECVLGNIKEVRETVDWIPNYNDSSVEPEFLPVEVPLLLINGNFGIGYGMGTNVPTHNINEVIDTTIQLIHNPDMDVVLLPDTCMKCEIIETDFESISKLGIGSFIVRGKVDIEGNTLTIRSIPDLTYLYTIIDDIKKFIEKKQLPQISKMYDKSHIDKSTNKDIMEYVIELKNGADPNYIKDFIYKNTSLQKTVAVNMEIIYNYNPKRISYKDYLNIFLDMRKVSKLRYYYNKLSKVNTKLHETDTYVKLLESGKIDEVIEMIKNNKDKNDDQLVKYLADLLNVTEFQATYVINANLKKLSLLHLEKYRAEREELTKRRDLYVYMIKDEQALLNEIEQELIMYKNKYGKPRNANIISKSEMVNIPQGRFKLIITEKNCIKKVPENASIGSFKEDKAKLMIEADNVENILIFTKEGKVYKLPVHKIPLSNPNSNGTPINIISNKIFGNVVTVMYEPALEELTKRKKKYFITVLTTKGYIKKMDIDDFLAVPPSGIIYSKLEENDYICDVSLVGNGVDIVIYNWTNKALRININDVPHLKRSTKGNITFSNIQEGVNQVLGMSVIKPNDTDIIVITCNGKINRLSVAALACSKRNTTGSKVIKLAKDDAINTIMSVNENDTLFIQTQNSKNTIPVNELAFGSSVSSGNKIIPKNEHILECSVI